MKQRPEHSRLGSVNGLTEIGEFPQIHTPQHVPIEVCRPGDTLVSRNGGIAGDCGGLGNPVGVVTGSRVRSGETTVTVPARSGGRTGRRPFQSGFVVGASERSVG